MDDQVAPPELHSTSDSLARAASSPLLAVGFSCSDDAFVLDDRADAVLSALGVDAFAILDRAFATGSAGEVFRHDLFGNSSATPDQTDRADHLDQADHPDQADRADHPDQAVQTVLLVGIGELATGDFRRAGAALTRAVRGSRGDVATSIGALGDDDQLAAFVEGLVLGGFAYRLGSARSGRRECGQMRGVAAQAPPLTLTDLPADRHAVVTRSTAAAKASWRARSFALTPSNLKNPAQLEQWAREAAETSGLAIDVWDDDRLAADGFGGILAVGSGSVHESRFIRLDYVPDAGSGVASGKQTDRHTRHVVLVGKGITFDSGGISIKPRDAMMTMKRDMTGAGVVIAVMGALRELRVGVRVTGLVASAENAFGAASMRPGDVVRHVGGRTSQVDNTDAEGRLVLADALAYAAEHIEADAVVDIATLTGAGKVAMGTSLGVLFANDDALASALGDAGRVAGEPVWRLPLSADYEDLLEAPFADASNAAGGPGAITAALFLQHFAGSAPWAHLDIASVGDSPKDAFEYTQGATGFGARLLLRWLQGLERHAGQSLA